MSDIQTRLADINRRSAESRAARDRQFWSIVAYVWLVAIGIVFAVYSLPQAAEADHQLYLANQESRNG
ncbi:hypothetical protein [Rhizobium gallicum]|uniref:hypothetical protein n=1 Tax=Rhizobium gallicum TaxID=56730 RepID=UPI001EF8CC37|nr:hypothetical protein [Rhizobium gallicum]ULJ73635.1 hypothetical protein L2W42_08705 [Rhizobium gallicum]